MRTKNRTASCFCLVAFIGVVSSLISFSGHAFAWSDNTKVNTPICTAGNNQWIPKLISEGTGGAIITWRDSRNGYSDIYAQRINKDGTLGETETPDREEANALP